MILSLSSKISLEPYAPAIVSELIAGRLDPLQIPTPNTSPCTSWLDAIEHALFDETGEDDVEVRRIRCHHGGFRLARNLSNDDVPRIIALLRAAERYCHPDALFVRLLAELEAFDTRLLAPASGRAH